MSSRLSRRHLLLGSAALAATGIAAPATAQLGSLTIRHRFLDFTGKYVYHCHLLFHEDHGMMGIVEVVE